MIKLKLTILLLLILPISLMAQLKVNIFEDIDSLQKLQKRPLLVFIHADWCKYCQAMKSTTLKNVDAVNLINSNFYYLELNAEEEQSIKFNGHTYSFKPNGKETGINTLAQQLGTIKGSLSLPMLCFLDDAYHIKYQYTGFLNAKELSKLIQKLQELMNVSTDD